MDYFQQNNFLNLTNYNTVSGETSIDTYEFMGRIRKMLGHFDFIDDVEEDNASSPAYIATHTRIILKLKCLDELSFATLRPISQLQQFTQDLMTSSRCDISPIFM